jgi:hypothetical protein
MKEKKLSIGAEMSKLNWVFRWRLLRNDASEIEPKIEPRFGCVILMASIPLSAFELHPESELGIPDCHLSC